MVKDWTLDAEDVEVLGVDDLAWKSQSYFNNTFHPTVYVLFFCLNIYGHVLPQSETFICISLQFLSWSVYGPDNETPFLHSLSGRAEPQALRDR